MKHYLRIRIAVTVALIALLVAAVTSLISYQFTHASTLEHARQSLSQLARTVQRTANIAAYLDNSEIARDVTYGLSRSELVEAVSLTSVTGLKASFGRLPEKLDRDDAVHLTLESPFGPGQKIGDLTILPNREFIGRSARVEASRTALTLTGFIILVALLITHVVQVMFIEPIHQVAESLRSVVPGATLSIATPSKHRGDEIGSLVQYINHQLELVKQILDTERGLREMIQGLEKRFRMIFERASIGIFLLDQDGRLVMANPSFRKILGDRLMDSIESQGNACLDIMFEEHGTVHQMLNEIDLESTSASGDLLLKTGADEDERWVHCLFTRVMDDSGEAVLGEAKLQIIINDITDRKKHEQLISFQAERDPLTHLLNRRSAENKLQRSLEKAAAGESTLTIYMIDLDKFKPINDTFGHEAGDKVLIEVARRLSAIMRHEDIIARLGGDEFLVATCGDFSREGILQVAEKLLRALSEEIPLDEGTAVSVGASIGIADSLTHGCDLNELFSRADQAMYQVKTRGRNGYQIHARGD